VIDEAKQKLINLYNSSNNPEVSIENDLALHMLKFSTLFALKIKEQVTDSFSYISLVQQLNSMYEMHADGCVWLLKYLTYNK
jgi:hypothetical protein